MAIPGIFRPKLISDDETGLGLSYVGGGPTCNNPTAQWLRVYLNQSVVSVFSVGPGQLLPARAQSLPGLLNALEKIVQGCKNVNEDVSQRFGGHDGYY